MKSKLILLPLLLFALGCSKSEDPASAASCLISIVESIFYISGNPSTSSTTTFEYDNTKKLIKVSISSGVNWEYVWESGLVKSVKQGGILIEDWIYTNGKLSKINNVSGTQSDVVLNSEGQPTELYGQIYTYDTNGNVLTENRKGSALILYQFSNYDTNPNPAKLLAASVNLGFFPVREDGSGVRIWARNAALYGKNNHRQRSEATGSPKSVAYTYNAKGQVTTITESVLGQVSSVKNFSYLGCN